MIMVIPSKSSKVLESFVAYCNANPSLRFWQALLNWSGQPFILFSTKSLEELSDRTFTDPYNFEGKDH